jgi:trehalose 6-phosphate synthase/phosphatase
LADAINTAVTMPLELRKSNHSKLFKYVSKYTAAFWGVSFINELERIRLERRIPKLKMSSTCGLFKKSKMKKIFLLDYDGTLTSLQPLPEFAKPSTKVLQIISRLCSIPDCYVYILSGRPREQLDKWFGNIDVGLSAEHGCYYKHAKNVTVKEIVDEQGAYIDLNITSMHLKMDKVESSISSIGSLHSRPVDNGWYVMTDHVDSSWRDTILPLFQHYTER